MAATVSIITALYNHEAFVGEAIESVLAQSYQDFELILWDDGSRDGSLEIARRYARKDPKRIKCYTHEDRGNHGQENTRNEALKAASGRYICLLDSDDLWLPHKLEQQVALMESRPEVGLVYAPVRALLHDHGKILDLSPRGPLPQGKVFDDLVKSNFIHACSVMVRRECLAGLQAPFDAAYGAIGEFPLWLRIARDWAVAPVPEAVAVWRVHGSNTGTGRRIQGRRELVDLAARLAADPAYGAHGEAIARARDRYLYDLAVILAEEGEAGDLGEARRLFAGLAARKDGAFPGALRRKSRIMARLTAMGRPWVRAFKAIKFISLIIRDPRQAALVSTISS